MTERVRRRASKWDLTDNPSNFSTGTIQDDASINKATERIHENEVKPEWISKNTGRGTKWSDTSTDGGFKSEENTGHQGWGPLSGTREEPSGGNGCWDVNEVSPNMKKWDESRGYSTSISPGGDGLRQQSRSRSPRRGWSNSHRSRSRSPPHGLRKRSRSPPHGLRNRSRSPPRGFRNRSRSPPRNFRNRSRSPSHGLKRDPEGRDDRIRGESRAPICNDFTKGRCMRGDQCRFLHEQPNGYDGRRPSGSVTGENWGSRPQGGYGRANNVEPDYSRDRFSHGHERDTRSYSGYDQRREPYRTVVPCKYFASGNCRKGTSCRFSHEGAAHEQPQNWRAEAADSAQGRPLHYVSDHIANNAWDGSEWNKKLTNSEDKAVHGRSQARSADEMWVHNPRDENKSWGGPKWGDEVTVSVNNGSVAGRLVNDSRDRISNNGRDNPAYNNTFVGWTSNDQALTDKPEKRPGEESLDHSMVDGKKSYEDPKWGVEAAGSANYSVEGKTVNDNRGPIASTTFGDPRGMKQPIGSTWDNEAADSEVKKVPQWGNAAKSEQIGVENSKVLSDRKWSNNASALNVTKTPEWTDDRKDSDVTNVASVPAPLQRPLDDRSYIIDSQKQSWGVPTWKANTSEPELTKAPEWRNGNDLKNGVAVSCPMSRSLDVKTDYNPDNQNRTWGIPTWSNKPSDHDVHKSSQISRSHEEVVSFTNQQSAGAEREQYPHYIGNEKGGFGLQDQQSHTPMLSQGQYNTQGVPSQQQQQQPPTISVYPEGVKHPATSPAITHPAVSNMILQSQQPLISSPSVRSFDLNGPVEDVPSPKHQSLIHMVETIKAGKVDPIVPPMTSGPIATQNTVTSEQVAQISHISASLAQIFGNGQQLPQLYATLNSTSSVGLVAPSVPSSCVVDAPIGGTFVQSNQNTWSQQPYGPVSNRMETTQTSTQPQGFSEKRNDQNHATNLEPQTQLQSGVLSSVTVGCNGSDPAINDNLEKSFQHGNELKQLESVGNERAAGVVKGQDNARSGDTNADARMDEDDKKSKETKAMRMFKFALVEFVKEILKPTWREGQLSKESHKTIVKKVVDKVTSAVQGEHIPQTQEKIDQYMAYSKTKLTKLVEAYLEKYLKS